MIDLIFSWSFLTMVIIPIVVYLLFHFADRFKPEILKKYKKIIMFVLFVYFVVFIIVPSLYASYNSGTNSAAPATISTENKQQLQNNQDLLQKPPEPIKGKGPGFGGFDK